MGTSKVLKKNSQIADREIEGEMILVPLYKSHDDLSYIYTLNETAAAAWKLIDGKKTLEQIKKALLNEFEVAEEVLDKQLAELIKDLRSIKAIA